MREIERKILSIFYDFFNRPKITPRHESAIVVMLENDYTPSQVQNSLNKLEKIGKLFFIKYRVEKGLPKFYFLNEFSGKIFQAKIEKKIESYALWIEQYSSKKITDVLGEHLHDLVKKGIMYSKF